MLRLLVLVELYNRLDNTYTSFKGFFKTLYGGIRTAFVEKSYYLFENISYPFLTNSVNVSASSSAMPVWYYLPSKKAFLKWENNRTLFSLLESKPQALPVLSMEILDKSAVVYDLTDFIEGLQVYTNDPAPLPSVAHILGAWSLSSGIILDVTRGFIVRMINTEANTVESTIDTYTYMDFHEARQPEAEAMTT